MAKLRPDEFAEKWARRLKDAAPDIERGVERVDESPTKKAVEKKEKLRKRWLEALDKGIWDAQMLKVSKEDWVEAVKTKGIRRVSEGVDAATGKMEEFGSWLLERVDEVKREIDKMPDVTLEDRIRRATEWMRKMAERKYRLERK